ncbi:MAG: hypothetical protein M1820_002146 [Bogoriella megaspora]|nr:MAG: hypothetical protein M1820_002146 [Bogoriella megaspora]
MSSRITDKFAKDDSSIMGVRNPKNLCRRYSLPSIPAEKSVTQHPPSPQKGSAEYWRSASGPDSGYASLTNSPEKRPLAPFVNNTKTGRKKLKVFNKDILRAARHRFSDLRELFGSSLHEYVDKKHNKDLNLGMIAWRLKVLGETEESAKPWIIVMCGSKASKTVRNYFKQKHVKQECQPDDTTIPSFEVYVYEWPLRQLATTYVYSEVATVEGPSPTLSGKMIHTWTGGKRRCATLGGIFEVVNANGTTTSYGMTVDHIFEDDNGLASDRQIGLAAMNILEDEDSDPSIGRNDIVNKMEQEGEGSGEREEYDDEEGEEGKEGEEGEEFIISPEDEFQLDFNDDPTRLELYEAATQLEKQILDDRMPIGELSLRSANIHERIEYDLDWALFSVDPEIMQLFYLCCSSMPISNLECRKTHPGTPVWIMTSRGAISGALQPSAFIMTNRATRAIEVFVVKLAGRRSAGDPRALQSHGLPNSLGLGDSGSWVIDQKTEKIYGYVVASDAFRDVYVVPFKLAWAEILSATGATACTLLIDEHDLISGRTERRKQRPPDSGYASKENSVITPPVSTVSTVYTSHGKSG